MPALELPIRPCDEQDAYFRTANLRVQQPTIFARKIRMFDEGEIAIFRKVGMIPVFFGEALAGRNLPQLTYMLAYSMIWQPGINPGAHSGPSGVDENEKRTRGERRRNRIEYQQCDPAAASVFEHSLRSSVLRPVIKVDRDTSLR